MPLPHRHLLGLAIATATACAPKPTPQIEVLEIDDPVGEAPTPSDAMPTSESVTRFGELTLRKGPCYGTCPVFTLVVEGNGFVWYYGGPHATFTGIFTGQVSSADLDVLAQLIVSTEYLFQGEDFRAGATDLATVRTSAVFDGRRKFVRNYGDAAPFEVAAIEAAIERLIPRVQWDDQRREIEVEPDVCHQLATSTIERCRPYLEWGDDGADCPHFAALLDDIHGAALSEQRSWGRRDEADAGWTPSAQLQQRCARHLRSFQLAAELDKPSVVLGDACMQWTRQRAQPLLATMRREWAPPHGTPGPNAAYELQRAVGFVQETLSRARELPTAAEQLEQTELSCKLALEI